MLQLIISLILFLSLNKKINMKNHLVDIVTYNHWANQRTVELLNQYDEEIITRSIVNSFSSIAETFYHTWGAEKIWLMRLQGKSLVAFPIFEGSLVENFEKGLQYSMDFIRYVESQPEEYFDSICTFQDTQGTTYSIPVQQIIHHCMNHSTSSYRTNGKTKHSR